MILQALAGGVDDDTEELNSMGVANVFEPGAATGEIVGLLRRAVAA